MPMESLQEIGERYGSDKFVVHRFGPVYERYFSILRNEPVRLLEIGIGGEDYEAGGASLYAWRNYFPRGHIVGIDLFDKSHVAGERIVTEICDQSDQAALGELWERHGGFDIVIDDGSHHSHHVLLAFFALFNRMRDGGIYVIEDTQTGYWPHYGGTSVGQGYLETSTTWLKYLVDCVNRHEILWPAHPALRAGFAVSEIHLHRNIAFVVRGEVIGSNVLDAETRERWLQADFAKAGIDAELARDLTEPAFQREVLAALQRLRDDGAI